MGDLGAGAKVQYSVRQQPFFPRTGHLTNLQILLLARRGDCIYKPSGEEGGWGWSNDLLIMYVPLRADWTSFDGCIYIFGGDASLDVAERGLEGRGLE